MYRLKFKWTISRGQNTYGYNICSLWVDGNKVSSCNGGGYDMKGCAFAHWLEEAFPEELKALADRAHTFYTVDPKGKLISGTMNEHPFKTQAKDTERLYGMVAYIRNSGEYETVKVGLDGACGMSSMQHVARALGYALQYVDESKNSTSYIMAESEKIDALHGIVG